MSESENSETVSDIVAEMRKRMKSRYYPKVARNIMHQYADRIEAATSEMLKGATIIDNRSIGNAIINTWKYPLTNLGHRGNQNRGPKTQVAIVRDAEGCVLMTFPGEPYRTNAEAIAKASEFCAAMNELHERVGNATTTGNAAAMHKALAEIRRELDCYCNGRTLLDRMTEDPPDYTCLRDSLLEIERIVDSARSTPPRNCDVGTAEEQYKRFQDFCLHNSFRGVCSAHCPLYTQSTIGSYQNTGRAICFPAWAQMPYEEGGAS